jgi:hypothetical protein
MYTLVGKLLPKSQILNLSLMGDKSTRFVGKCGSIEKCFKEGCTICSRYTTFHDLCAKYSMIMNNIQ